MLLAGGAALIAYTAAFARSGPAYLGVANLFAFVLLAGAASDDGPSLVGWPLLLLLGTARAARRGAAPPHVESALG